MFDRKDITLIKKIAFPAAGASAETESLDISSGAGNAELCVGIPALAALVASKSATVVISESDDNSIFANAPWAPEVSVVGATGGGAEAKEQRIGIPSTAKRYVKATVSVAADGGDNTAAELAFALAL